MNSRKKVLKSLLPVYLLAVTALAADVTGKWSGTLQIDEGGASKIERPLELQLAQKEGALSGKIGVSGEPQSVEIRNGKIEGDKMTFEASSPQPPASMKFSLTIQGQRMQGEMKGVVAGNDLVARVSLTRVP